MARALHKLALKTDFDSIYTLARKVDLISARRSDKAKEMQSVGAFMQEEGSEDRTLRELAGSAATSTSEQSLRR